MYPTDFNNVLEVKLVDWQIMFFCQQVLWRGNFTLFCSFGEILNQKLLV